MDKARIKSVATSWIHTVYVTEKHRVYVCGNNMHGAIGTLFQNSNYHEFVEPSLFKTLRPEKVACGRTYTLFLTKDGSLYASGLNEFGQMGTSDESFGPTKTPREAPMVVEVLNRLRTNHNAKIRDKQAKGQPVDPNEPNPGAVVDMAVGFDHSAVITQTGDIYMFGYNIDGQLGFGDTKDRTEPTKNTFFKDANIKIKSIACGQDTTGFLTDKGHLYMCGNNNWGQVGLDPKDHKTVLTPTMVDYIKGKNIVQVSFGGGHSLALTDKHEVYSWGWETEGRLGREPVAGKGYVPAMIHGLKDKKVVQVSAGGGHSLALTADGKVYSWGYGPLGRLGVGLMKFSKEPLLVEGLLGKKVLQVLAGADHSLVLVEEVG
eukprot:Phypoly_transcript_09478.p1 GENE.Phypoly_transcript_09478~~Phypoly_transcript_09478.p1  ORF type:complete len:375 (+),score=65.49 Phypoly_transcript_09478:275-1399(+)